MKPEPFAAPVPLWPDALSGIRQKELIEEFRNHLDRGIDSIRLTPMPGDASARRYYRIFFSAGPFPSAVLVVVTEPCPPDPMDFPFLNIRSFLAGLGLAVPEHYFSLPEQGIVVLEDFGDKTLESALQTASPPQAEAWYREALESLVKMQLSRGDCYAFTYAFTAAKFEEELLFFVKHAVEGLWGRRLSSGDREALTAEFRRLSEEVASLASGSAVFTHRDYHSRNLMVLNDVPRLGILDFQDARLGPPAYDLASLVFDSYVSLSPEFRETLIEHYRLRSKDLSGRGLDRDGLERSLRLAATQRNLKAVGTFAYQGWVLGRKGYLDSIGPTLEYVRDHCERLPELSGLWSLLSPLLPAPGHATARPS
ncbi:MAG: aminoglycoside phosphotransferase family protein [Nitrospinota bacterium]